MTITDEEIVARTKDLISQADPRSTDPTDFRGRQFDAGLAWVHFPTGHGGLDGARSQQAIVDRLLREAGSQSRDLIVNPIGIGMGAPTLLAYGSDELRRAHLRPIFTGEHVWCQLFSEPTAGSDVASARCRAEKDESGNWVVNGQKVWTTLAHVSRYGMLLARTDPEKPKHAGLSYFIVDMHAPGVEVRPLFQMTGEAEFNEVFLDEVHIPENMMLGERGDGWRVATTTLMNERVALSGGGSRKGAGAIRTLLDAWQQHEASLSPSTREAHRLEVADLWIRAEVLRLTNLRAKAALRAGVPGPVGSVGKLMAAELNQRIFNAAVDLGGASGLLHPEGYPMRRADPASASTSANAQFLRSRANTIEGGTSEIMRNILAERVLGLPRDPAQ